MKPTVLTKAFKSGNQTIAVFQYCKDGRDSFKIMKKCINYVRGNNVESWRVMGSASTFDNMESCISKFESLVNKHRASIGKEPVKFTVE